jgi:hypothetical protein
MRLVRFGVLAVVTLAVGAAQAQVTILTDERLAYDQIQEALNAFSVNRSAKFELKITESADFWTKRYGYTEGSFLYDTLSAKPSLLFELNEFGGSKLQAKTLLRRMVADGSTFYVYDVASNTYSASPYTGRDLFRFIAKATRSTPSTLIGKLLLQAYGGPYPSFKPSDWLPRAQPVPAGKNDAFATLQYGNSNIGETSVAFNLSSLGQILYTQRAPGNMLNAPSINWELTTFRSTGGFGNYRFAPPANAKQVPL